MEGSQFPLRPSLGTLSELLVYDALLQKYVRTVKMLAQWCAWALCT